MSLSLVAGTLALAPNLTTGFLGIGGTSPYIYSVAMGGAGGTIDSSSGLYTAPLVTGTDTVIVTDAASATAEATIQICTPIELLCDIIQNQMGLTQGQVYEWDQKINIPTDSRLYITIGVLSCKPFANSNKMDANGIAIQSVNMSAVVSIDILSRGPEARDRKEEVLLSLMSNYAQSQQTTNSFYVGQLSTNFANLSLVDGAAIPYRFNISVALQYFVTLNKAVPYFDDFDNVEVDTDA